uniref:Uncharacterized protein n=1 Tax=Rhizophora mucronata TaxID=61149 RepID=A0A2P2ITD9_RHIMU
MVLVQNISVIFMFYMWKTISNVQNEKFFSVSKKIPQLS